MKRNYLKIGSNCDFQLVNIIKEINSSHTESVINEVYGSRRESAALTARPAFRLLDIDRKTFCNYVKSLREVGVIFNYAFFDTAEIYGTQENPHDNEELLGKALKPYRDKIVLATKFGIHFDMESTAVNKPLVPDSRPSVIRASVEDSLKRLDTGHIDLYYQHRTDPKVPVEEVAGVMADLIKEGKITHWGLSEADEDTIRRAHKVCPVTAIQNRYSMMARWHEKLFPVLEELNIGYVAFSPLANGFLSAKYDKNTEFDGVYDYRSMMPQFSRQGMEQNHDLLKLLDPALIADLVQSVDATIVECNTAYGGSRTETAMHMQVAEDHGFTAIADVDILDAEGSMELPVEGGKQVQSNRVGSHFANYDSYCQILQDILMWTLKMYRNPFRIFCRAACRNRMGSRKVAWM